jgi:hypothetical protein
MKTFAELKKIDLQSQILFLNKKKLTVKQIRCLLKKILPVSRVPTARVIVFVMFKSNEK